MERPPVSILLAERDEHARLSLSALLEREGYHVVQAWDGRSLNEALDRNGTALLLFDPQLPGSDGLRVVSRMKASNSTLPIILMADRAQEEQALHALSLREVHFIAKPVDMVRLLHLINRLVPCVSPSHSIELEESPGTPRPGIGSLVGLSISMREIADFVRRIAASEASTVLIVGESGTGKDLIARIIHNESKRRTRRFVGVTCTSLQDSLLESELFGHEKGAFTDARKEKRGLLEVADGGTVFMNEIGDMSMTLQGKLLQALEEKSFRRVGGTRDLRVDVRVIAATNQDLEKQVLGKVFREDLYYRLNVLRIELPPLRTRREDILPLARHFSRMYAREFGKKFSEIPERYALRLEEYAWRGNIRELRNAIERTALLSRGEVLTFDHLPPAVLADSLKVGRVGDERYLPRLKDAVARAEREAILAALKRSRWNQYQAALSLGITRKTLAAKMKSYRIARPGKGSPSNRRIQLVSGEPS